MSLCLPILDSFFDYADYSNLYENIPWFFSNASDKEFGSTVAANFLVPISNLYFSN